MDRKKFGALISSLRKDKEMDKKQFGVLVSSLRDNQVDENGNPLTQQTLAQKANIPIATLDNIENGQLDNLSQEILYSLANALQLTSLERREFFMAALGNATEFSDSENVLIDKVKLSAISTSKIRELTFIISPIQQLTPDYLYEKVAPYLQAIEKIQQFIDELQKNEHYSTRITKISQNSPISVSLDGASEAIQIIKETVTPWRRRHVETMANLAEQEKVVEIENAKASVLAKRAEAVKERVESEKLKAEIDKSRQETERLKLENKRLRLEIEKEKVQLALNILAQIAPNLSEKDKVSYLLQLIQPLDVVVSSELEIA